MNAIDKDKTQITLWVTKQDLQMLKWLKEKGRTDRTKALLEAAWKDAEERGYKPGKKGGQLFVS